MQRTLPFFDEMMDDLAMPTPSYRQNDREKALQLWAQAAEALPRGRNSCSTATGHK